MRRLIPARARARARCVRRGTWRPAALLGSDRRALYVILVAQALTRGIEYATSDAPAPYTHLGVWLPAWVTATAYLLGGTGLAAGALFAAHQFVWGAHVWLATTHTILAAWLTTWAIQAGTPQGISHAAAYLTIAVLHALLALRTGPRPLPTGVARGEAVRDAPS